MEKIFISRLRSKISEIKTYFFEQRIIDKPLPKLTKNREKKMKISKIGGGGRGMLQQ